MAQNRILGRDLRITRVIPDPFVVTTSGTYQYTASSALVSSVDGVTTYDIRRVARVYAHTVKDIDIFAYGGIAQTTYRPEKYLNPSSLPDVEIPVDCIPSVKAASSDCKVIFWRENNPATTTNVYIAEAYKWPTQLTAESIAISVPEQFQSTLLCYEVMKVVEEMEFGRGDYNEDAYERELKRFLTYATGGATTDDMHTSPREV